MDARNDFHGKEHYVLKREKGNKKSAVEKERVASNALALGYQW